MTYAIISDIHANESALRRVLADAAAQGAEQVVCLGDVVGYGPLPKETLALVRKVCAAVLAGNHDDAVSGRLGANDFIDLAGEAVGRHRGALDADGLAWLKSLPYTCKLGEAVAAHGDFTNPPAFNYIESEQDAQASFSATGAQLMFVGHTHVPALFLTGQSGAVYRLAPQDFVLEDDKRYIVNPGSVGYPREQDGRCLSSYVLYDSATRTVSFRFLPFSVASVMQRGTNPRRRIGILVALLVLAGAAVAAALFFASRPPDEKEVVVEVSRQDNPALVLDRKSLTLTKTTSSVRANLKLDRKSCPVELIVEFKSTTGEVLDSTTDTVKKSSRRPLKIPAGAISAHFTILRQKPDDQPKIKTFAPTAN